MQNSGLARRGLIYGSLAFVEISSLLRLPANATGTLPLTPRQTPGPFYPLSFPQNADNDLVHVAGRQGTAASRGSLGAFSTRMDGLFREHGSRFGNAMRMADITTCGMVGLISRATRISRAMGPRQAIRAAGI